MKRLITIGAAALAAGVAVAATADVPVQAQSPCRDISFSTPSQGTMLYGAPVHLVDGQPFAKDPTVIRHGGRYLMYYTVNDDGRWGGAIAESTNLVDWVRVGDIAVDGAPFEGGWVAPCVKKFDGKRIVFGHMWELGHGKWRFDERLIRRALAAAQPICEDTSLAFWGDRVL